jgi:hypothetical protein
VGLPNKTINRNKEKNHTKMAEFKESRGQAGIQKKQLLLQFLNTPLNKERLLCHDNPQC